EHDVRLAVARALHGLLAVRGQADELHVGQRLDEPAEAVPDDAVVVGDEDADHRAGTSNSTVVPSPGRECTARVPRDCFTRVPSSGRPTWPCSARASRSPGAKPLPSSVTTSRVVSSIGRVTSMRTLSASAYFCALRSASRATR